MRKYRFMSICLVIAFLLSACQTQKHPQSKQSAYMMEKILAEVEKLDIYELSVLISPDGKWLSPSFVATQNLNLLSLSAEDPEKTLSAAFPPELGKIIYVASWSPDSRYLAFVGTQGSRFDECDQVVVADISGDAIKLSSFDLPFDLEGRIEVHWSPDSQKLLVYVLNRTSELFMIDPQGNLLQRIPFTADVPAKEIQTTQAWWGKSGMVYLLTEETDYTVLYKFNPNNSDYTIEKSLEFSLGDWTQYILLGTNPEETHLHLFMKARDGVHLFSSIQKVDLSTGIQEEIRPTKGNFSTIRVPVFSDTGRYMAMNISEGEKDYVIVFDFTSDKFKSYRNSYAIENWLPLEQGFLVINRDKDDKITLDVIYP